MTKPAEVVVSYIDHLQDASYVQAAVAEHGIPVLIATAVRLVNALQTDDVNKATLFIRDLSTGLLGTDLAGETRSVLPSSGLFDALDGCLRTPNFAVRSQAVHTLGRLTFRENVDLLDRIFRDRRDLDPLLMPDLLFEICWLESDDDGLWARARHLAESPNALSRWAALAVIGKHFKHETVPAVDHILSRAAFDEFAPIRAEAVYRRSECDRRIRNRHLTREQFKAERTRLRAERSAVEALRPRATFDLVGLAFWNAHRASDYTTADVVAFLESRKGDEAG